MTLALLPAQRFRLLQRVNDLRIKFVDGTDRYLTTEERDALSDALEVEGDLTFKTGICKAIGLKRKGITFNHEEGGEKKLVGNRTGVKLRGVFVERWEAFTDGQRSQILSEVLGVHKEETTARLGREVWGLDAEAADKLAGSRTDIDKYRLWLECNKRCPYTGKSIAFGAHLGDSPRFDIEHIWPFSRTLDESFRAHQSELPAGPVRRGSTLRGQTPP